MFIKNYNTKLIYLFLLLVSLYSCSEDNFETLPLTNDVIEAFKAETGLVAVYYMDTSILRLVKSWQGKDDYLGVDDWATAKIPNSFDLLGGLPVQGQFYSINQTLLEADTLKVAYWESLQVKADPDHGLRPYVGIFDIKNDLDTIIVAISKVLANPCYGEGGAWQIYVDDFKNILGTTPVDTIPLQPKKEEKSGNTEYVL